MERIIAAAVAIQNHLDGAAAAAEELQAQIGTKLVDFIGPERAALVEIRERLKDVIPDVSLVRRRMIDACRHAEALSTPPVPIDPATGQTFAIDPATGRPFTPAADEMQARKEMAARDDARARDAAIVRGDPTDPVTGQPWTATDLAPEPLAGDPFIPAAAPALPAPEPVTVG